MRTLLIALVVVLAVTLYKPWQYTWAFGQDAGAERSADWKDKPCTQELARALYRKESPVESVAKKGNRFFVPGSPGHTYFVYGFRSQASCEEARQFMGTAQWDQSTL